LLEIECRKKGNQHALPNLLFISENLKKACLSNTIFMTKDFKIRPKL
jgi:hypothetical protein